MDRQLRWLRRDLWGWLFAALLVLAVIERVGLWVWRAIFGA